jgi:transcriptional regulator with XRE-family HTH domain
LHPYEHINALLYICQALQFFNLWRKNTMMLPTEKPALIARLVFAMEEKHISKAALARECETSPQTVNGWLTTGRIAKERLPDLSRVLGVSVDWIIAGENGNALAGKDPRYVTIPQLDTGGAMGRGVELNEFTGVIANWQVSHEWAAKNLPAHTGLNNLKIVTGFGDSMRGVFEPGDPLIVDAGIKECAADGMYFYRVGTEAFIKRLQRIPTAAGIVYRVLSENAAYPPYDIAVGMEIEILAKVIKVWRSTVF